MDLPPQLNCAPTRNLSHPLAASRNTPHGHSHQEDLMQQHQAHTCSLVCLVPPNL